MQKITIAVKQAGKKHPLIAARDIELNYDENIITLRQLLTLLVQDEVERYNAKAVSQDDVDTLTKPIDDYTEILLNTGKAGFGAKYNENKVDVEEAIDTAIQAFEDGLFAVFYGDEAIENLTDTINLELKEKLTLIRLIFLSGGLW